MSDNIMLDTNIWIYLYSKQSIEKTEIVRQLLASNSEKLTLSTQILGELYNVFRRKKLVPLDQATEILQMMIDSFTIEPIDHPKVSIALEISARYGYTYWDSLVIATAIDCKCTILYSEDMQHNILIRDRLRIINPLSNTAHQTHWIIRSPFVLTLSIIGSLPPPTLIWTH